MTITRALIFSGAALTSNVSAFNPDPQDLEREKTVCFKSEREVEEHLEEDFFGGGQSIGDAFQVCRQVM